MKRLLNVLFWSVIAAAFIGPGTVTSAARAGSDFGFALAWALLFSTVACLVLQEASARITVLSGQELGQALAARFAAMRSARWIPAFLAVAVFVGCAAYEAGNLLGGVAGLGLLTDLSPTLLSACCGLLAAALLATGSTRWIARTMGALVAVMGVAFLLTALRLAPEAGALAAGLLVPRVPAGSTLLIMALVGTTVVPYNLFLGSALARDQQLGEMRWGLAVAVLGGGLISLGVLVVGSALGGALEYARLAEVLSSRLGPGAGASLAVGLFAAGLSSAVTAPLAAALTARALLGKRWREDSIQFRAVWASALLVGVAFAMARVQPIPAIIMAQALNGVLLPLVAIFLWLTMNDRELLGDKGVNSRLQNLLMGAVCLVCVVLGLRALLAAGARVISLLGF